MTRWHRGRMKTTRYFDSSVRMRRPYLSEDQVEFVLSSPLREITQPNGRICRWGFVKEAGRYLRVVTESDGETVHNAFYDRRFKP